MIRKVRIRLLTEHGNTLAMMQEETEHSRWPKAWGELAKVLQTTLDPLLKTYNKITQTLLQLEEWELLEIDWLDEEEPFWPFEIDVDLVELLHHDDGEDVANLFLKTLDDLNELNGFDLRIWLGGRRGSLKRTRQAVVEQAEEYGIEVEQPRSRKRSKKKKDKKHSSKDRKKRQWRRTYSWGGLDDEEVGDDASWQKQSAQLSESAQFFLSYTSLSWPCSVVELNKAWHKALHNSHPDKFPNDPGAKDRTQLINVGYNELKSIIQRSA
ncbi:MAG: hypothetical protein EP343_00785 [Deltaproteobacteria bacterium]|nr:MAG: hypothetical protein EP343_00785 [Deltaproteobacteria bacterium]